MPRGASSSLCIPEVALEQLALLCGTPQWPFQGAVAEGELQIEAPLVTQEPPSSPQPRLQTGSERSGAAQQMHRAPFLQPHPGQPAQILFLRAPRKLRALNSSLFCFIHCQDSTESRALPAPGRERRADTGRALLHSLLHSGAPHSTSTQPSTLWRRDQTGKTQLHPLILHLIHLGTTQELIWKIKPSSGCSAGAQHKLISCTHFQWGSLRSCLLFWAALAFFPSG